MLFRFVHTIHRQSRHIHEYNIVTHHWEISFGTYACGMRIDRWSIADYLPSEERVPLSCLLPKYTTQHTSSTASSMSMSLLYARTHTRDPRTHLNQFGTCFGNSLLVCFLVRTVEITHKTTQHDSNYDSTRSTVVGCDYRAHTTLDDENERALSPHRNASTDTITWANRCRAHLYIASASKNRRTRACVRARRALVCSYTHTHEPHEHEPRWRFVKRSRAQIACFPRAHRTAIWLIITPRISLIRVAVVSVIVFTRR